MKSSLSVLQKKIEYLCKNKNIEAISLDVFDTMIYRFVEEPVDVFEVVAERALAEGLLPNYLKKEDYKNLRIQAEKQARNKKKSNKGITEVSFEEIFLEMPSFICNANALRQLEYEVEKEICYASPIIKELIEWIHIKKIKLICISDMYFSKRQIQEILNAAGYTNKFDIFVSSEYGVTKSSGDLFKKVLNELGISYDGLLHIGDNYTSDYLMPKKQGIFAIHCDVLHDDEDKGLMYENMIYEKNLTCLSAMRRYITLLNKNLYDDKWFNIGAQIYGPFFSAFADWVVDVAKNEKIDKIYPLMREGKLLSKLISNAAQAKGYDLQISPLYISRKAVYIPSLKKCTKNKVEDIFNAPEIRLNDVMKIFGVEEFEFEFRERFGSCKGKNYYEIADDFWIFLHEEKIYKKFREHCDKENRNALGYFEQIGVTKERCITVDIGFHGTIQRGLEIILDNRNNAKKNIHLLGITPKTTVYKVFEDGLDIRGFVGNYGYNDEMNTFITWHHRLLEQATMCDEPTTKGYRCIDGSYEPVMGEVLADQEKQWEYIDKLQKGIIAYQHEYLRLKKENEFLQNSKIDNRELLLPYVRLVTVPTKEEAETLGILSHDENYGVDVSFSLCSPEKIGYIKNNGWLAYCSRFNASEELWIEGLRTLGEEEYEFKNLVKNVKSRLGKGMSSLALAIYQNNKKKEPVVIIGAGQAGRTLKFFLQLLGLKVECFMDNNKALQGDFVDGVIVKPLCDMEDVDYFALGTLAFADRLMGQARDCLHNHSRIFCYRDGAVCVTEVSKEANERIW